MESNILNELREELIFFEENGEEEHAQRVLSAIEAQEEVNDKEQS